MSTVSQTSSPSTRTISSATRIFTRGTQVLLFNLLARFSYVLVNEEYRAPFWPCWSLCLRPYAGLFQMGIVPVGNAPELIDLVFLFAEAVTFARIQYQLSLDAISF